MSKRNKAAKAGLECQVNYETWISFLNCHRRRSGGKIEGWPACLNELLRDGLESLQKSRNGGDLLGAQTDCYQASASGRFKTLTITPTHDDLATIRQHSENTRYKQKELVALLLRIGYGNLS